MLAWLSLVAGLIVAAAALPVVGIGGVAARDAAKTFSTLPVPSLGACRRARRCWTPRTT